MVMRIKWMRANGGKNHARAAFWVLKLIQYFIVEPPVKVPRISDCQHICENMFNSVKNMKCDGKYRGQMNHRAHSVLKLIQILHLGGAW